MLPTKKAHKAFEALAAPPPAALRTWLKTTHQEPNEGHGKTILQAKVERREMGEGQKGYLREGVINLETSL